MYGTFCYLRKRSRFLLWKFFVETKMETQPPSQLTLQFRRIDWCTLHQVELVLVRLYIEFGAVEVDDETNSPTL